MNGNERQLLFADEFYESLDGILDYISPYVSSKYIREFLTDLDYFIPKKILPWPESHTEYKYKRTPDRSFRRAIFRKKYYIIYKVSDEYVEILLIVSSKRDLTKISIQD